MKTYFFFIPLVIALLFASCKKDDESNNQIATDLDVFDFKNTMELLGNEQLIDVRTPAEWATGSILFSLNIDYYAADFEQQVLQLDKQLPVMVYCGTGDRGTSAMEELNDLGFTEVYNLIGGLVAWESAGYPVVR